MHQMHTGAVRLEQVGRPVPAVGRLESDLGIRARLRHRHRELHRVIHHLVYAEHLTVLGHPHDDRPSSMQVDTDVLSLLHVGASSVERDLVWQPRVFQHSPSDGARPIAPLDAIATIALSPQPIGADRPQRPVTQKRRSASS